MLEENDNSKTSTEKMEELLSGTLKSALILLESEIENAHKAKIESGENAEYMVKFHVKLSEALGTDNIGSETLISKAKELRLKSEGRVMDPEPMSTAPKDGTEVLAIDQVGNIGWSQWVEDPGWWSWDYEEYAIGWWPKPKVSQERLEELLRASYNCQDGEFRSGDDISEKNTSRRRSDGCQG